MRTGLLASLVALVATAPLALAQQPAAWPAPPSAPPALLGQGGPPGADGGPEAPGPAAEERAWFTAEPLLWWFKGSPFPVPLVTTTSDPTVLPVAALGPPTTSVVLGNQNVGQEARYGARFQAGYWLDDHATIGLDAGYFFVASQSTTQQVRSSGLPGSPTLATPFVDGDLFTESSFVFAGPGTAAGLASLSLTSRLQGAEVNGVVAVYSSPSWRVNVLGGFRFLDLRENATFATFSTGTQAPGAGSNNGLVLNTVDQFDTQNQFYGCQIGARAEYRLDGLFVNASVKIGVGEAHQVATIAGSATTNFFNAPAGVPFTGVPVQFLPGSGTFAQPSNAGQASRDQVAWAHQVGIKVGYQFTQGLCAFVGYDFLYLSNVARPGNQIDRVINVEQTVQNAIAGNPTTTGARPVELLTGSAFWAQGINLGVELSF
jgi:hypothetical protein